jgi:hypothetical protein
LNIPPPGEPPYKQVLRRIGWSIFAIIAPEVVALNAWLQYNRAKQLMHVVNEFRGLRPKRPPRTLPRRLLDGLWWLIGKLGMICMSPILIIDRLRMIFCHTCDSRALNSEQRRVRIHEVASQLDKNKLPWTVDTAFYAISGGATTLLDGRIVTLTFNSIFDIGLRKPKVLLPLQRAVLQDPSKASGLAKFITCAQAFWFCSQCIARLSQNMAISLLELNTFAHCISAFFIYVFWWHKPYDVATHVYIEQTDLAPVDKKRRTTRSKNMTGGLFSSFDWAEAGVFRPLIVFLTFLLYGALHSLACKYRFPTPAEGTIWRCASVATASSGLILLVTILRGNLWGGHWSSTRKASARRFLYVVLYFLYLVAIAARSFLVFESFRALPNSPASIYEVPRWTAYIPHI